MFNKVGSNSNNIVIKEANLTRLNPDNNPQQEIVKENNQIDTNDKTKFNKELTKQPSFDPEKSNISFDKSEQKEEQDVTGKAVAAIISFFMYLASGDASPEGFSVVQQKLSEANAILQKTGVPSESVKMASSQESESDRFKKMSKEDIK
ncbi:MAG: hypothetical protein U0354_00900 [Candidatus Sericytochromatia bacterium]